MDLMLFGIFLKFSAKIAQMSPKMRFLKWIDAEKPQKMEFSILEMMEKNGVNFLLKNIGVARILANTRACTLRTSCSFCQNCLA